MAKHAELQGTDCLGEGQSCGFLPKIEPLLLFIRTQYFVILIFTNIRWIFSKDRHSLQQSVDGIPQLSWKQWLKIKESKLHLKRKWKIPIFYFFH